MKATECAMASVFGVLWAYKLQSVFVYAHRTLLLLLCGKHKIFIRLRNNIFVRKITNPSSGSFFFLLFFLYSFIDHVARAYTIHSYVRMTEADSVFVYFFFSHNLFRSDINYWCTYNLCVRVCKVQMKSLRFCMAEFCGGEYNFNVIWGFAKVLYFRVSEVWTYRWQRWCVDTFVDPQSMDEVCYSD